MSELPRTTTVSLGDELRDRLNSHVKDNGTNKSAVVREALWNFFGHNSIPETKQDEPNIAELILRRAAGKQ